MYDVLPVRSKQGFSAKLLRLVAGVLASKRGPHDKTSDSLPRPQCEDVRLVAGVLGGLAVWSLCEDVHDGMPC